MAVPVIMPRQGQSVETCFITKWHKTKGEEVREGDLLFSYETDKAAFDEEAKESGILLEIFFGEGEEVPVLENVAVIGRTGEDFASLIPGRASGASTGDYDVTEADRSAETKFKETAPARDEQAGGEQAGGEPDSTQPAKTAPAENESATAGTIETVSAVPESDEGLAVDYSGEEAPDGRKIRVSPLARKLAKEHNVPLAKIKGSGPRGRIIERDIRDAAARIKEGIDYRISREEEVIKSSDPPEYKTGLAAGADKIPESESEYSVRKLSNMRRIIAGKMERSLQNSAQLTHHMSADARKMLSWRKDIKSGKGKAGVADININDMVCYAVIRALKKHAFMNAHFMGDSIKVFNKVHLGIAVDTERGLMVPVVRDADDINVGGLARRIKEISGECRKGSVDPGLLDSKNASFTVTNLGTYGVEMFTPVLNLPQVGILGVNTITYRPADTGDGVIGFVPMIGLSLTYDHRAVDGAPASVFLAEVKKEIENIESSGA